MNLCYICNLLNLQCLESHTSSMSNMKVHLVAVMELFVGRLQILEWPTVIFLSFLSFGTIMDSDMYFVKNSLTF